MATDNFVESLRQKHANLEDRIHTELARPYHDSAAVQRMKFEKLRLKERIDEHTRH
ncbi:YdcH family protein [Nitrospirillum iridis]|uniref:DUF465 domain-containing protein n=1 Tax=Nitrospirillum iridis TaxID=765888 RepID=A0A7X0AXY7_9PROT|nr:YdcH family protein [Nitrospirillum iridis]MBB6250659.1 hypothetical protein [Nitrospirillum iridis]